jgi:transcriptional regulator with XRE-family HTH domain
MHPLMSARRARRLSRERLAALAGVSARTIYALEVEGGRPQHATRHVLAEALGLDAVELFPANENESPGRATRSEATDAPAADEAP